jgi:hypothetical protein
MGDVDCYFLPHAVIFHLLSLKKPMISFLTLLNLLSFARDFGQKRFGRRGLMAQYSSGTVLFVIGSDTMVRCVFFDLQRKRPFPLTW